MKTGLGSILEEDLIAFSAALSRSWRCDDDDGWVVVTAAQSTGDRH